MGEEAEGGELEAGVLGELLVELDGVALDGCDEDFEAGLGGVGGGIGRGVGRRALAGGRRGARGELDGATDLEVDDGFGGGEGKVAGGLEEDEAGELGGVVGGRKEEGAKDDLGTGDAEDNGGGLEAELAEGAGDGVAEEDGVGAVGVGREVEGDGGEAVDGRCGGARGGLADAEDVAVEVEGGDDGGGARASLPPEGEAEGARAGRWRGVSHGDLRRGEATEAWRGRARTLEGPRARSRGA